MIKYRSEELKACALLNQYYVGNAHPPLGWVRGPWPTWRRGARQVRRAVDVGLEFLVLLFQDKRTNKTAAIDARRRTGPRRHDMAANLVILS